MKRSQFLRLLLGAAALPACGVGLYVADTESDVRIHTHKTTDAEIACGKDKLPRYPSERQLNRYMDCVEQYSGNTDVTVTVDAEGLEDLPEVQEAGE